MMTRAMGSQRLTSAGALKVGTRKPTPLLGTTGGCSR